MANEKIKQNYRDIANAIRAKTGENSLISAEDMPSKIGSDLAKKPEGSLSITENGDNINVEQYAAVDVNVEGYPEPSGTLSITENGDNIDVKDYEYVDVDVEGGATPEEMGVYYYPGGVQLELQTEDIFEDGIYYFTGGSEVGQRHFFRQDLYTFDDHSGGSLYGYKGGSEFEEFNVSAGSVYFAGGSNTFLDSIYLDDGNIYKYNGNTYYSDEVFENLDLNTYRLYFYTGDSDQPFTDEGVGGDDYGLYWWGGTQLYPYDDMANSDGLYWYIHGNTASDQAEFTSIELPDSVGGSSEFTVTGSDGQEQTYKIIRLS